LARRWLVDGKKGAGYVPVMAPSLRVPNDGTGFGCRNPRERCDATFLKHREPCVHRVCRKDFLGKVPEKISGKLFCEKFGEVDYRWS